jgi:Cytochrome P460
MRVVRAKLVAVVAVVALAAAFAVVATARTTANGLPAYTNGWPEWPRVNERPFRDRGPLSSAHTGLKNVYASKRKRGGRYPNGTVVVKTIVRPGTRYVGQFAVMRKLDGRWRFVEYERESARARYTLLAQGQLCVDCHVMARRTDYVFTQR